MNKTSIFWRISVLLILFTVFPLLTHAAMVCKQISSSDLGIPANTTGYNNSNPIDVSNKFSLPSGNILVKVTGANTTNGTLKVSESYHTTFNISGSKPVRIKAIHGGALGAGLKDKIFIKDGASYTLLSTLTSGLSAGDNVNPGYYVKNTTNTKINDNDFIWFSDTNQNFINFGTTSTSLNARIGLKLCTVIIPAPTVEITEDTDNNGEISQANELDGNVDVLFTFTQEMLGMSGSVTVPNGDVVAFNKVYQADIDNGWVQSYPASDFPVGTKVTVSITVTDAAGNVSPTGSDTAKIIDDIASEVTIESIDSKTSTSISTTNQRPEVNGTCEVGDTITIFIDKQEITPIVICTEKGTYSVIPDTDIEKGEHNVTAMAIDKAGNEILTNAILLNIISLPDYEVALNIDHTTFINEKDTFFTIIRVGEIAKSVNTGNIIYSINKNKKIKLSFDNTMTLSPDGIRLGNENWKLINTDTAYLFKYIGNTGEFNAGSQIFFGISGTFTPPSNASGEFILKIKLKSGSGDTTEENNEDSDSIIYLYSDVSF